MAILSFTSSIVALHFKLQTAHKPFVAADRRFGCHKFRLRRRNCGLRDVDLYLIGFGIELDQQIAFANDVVFLNVNAATWPLTRGATYVKSPLT